MKLFFTKGACSLAVRIIINELEIPCTYEAVDLKTKKTESGDDFLAINIKGSVPTLELDNGKILTENAVILQYLADSNQAYSLLPEVGQLSRYRVLEWLNYITTELHKTFGALFNPAFTEEMRDTIFIPMIHQKLAYVNEQLQGNQFLLGDTFTLPDAYLFVILRWAMYFKIDLKPYSHLQNFSAGLAKRKSVQESLKQEV